MTNCTVSFIIFIHFNFDFVFVTVRIEDKKQKQQRSLDSKGYVRLRRLLQRLTRKKKGRKRERERGAAPKKLNWNE